MKNTLQRYIGFYKLQEVDALFRHNLASFNKEMVHFCTFHQFSMEKSDLSDLSDTNPFSSTLWRVFGKLGGMEYLCKKLMCNL